MTVAGYCCDQINKKKRACQNSIIDGASKGYRMTIDIYFL